MNRNLCMRQIRFSHHKINKLRASSSLEKLGSAISKSHPSLSDSPQNKILLLQGPVGPFFNNLQRYLKRAGFLTKRIVFHSADALFSARNDTVRFSGSPMEWESWLHNELTHNRPDAIVLFGSNRPAHSIAHNIAEKFGIPVIALEEGYLRSGYISCELGGNNQRSPLNRWKQGNAHPPFSKPLSVHCSFFMMCFWGATYYLTRSITKKEKETTLYHRQTGGAVKESLSWTSHMIRRLFLKIKERPTIKRLIKNSSKNYILVPLQTSHDAQIRFNSRGWDNKRLIQTCLKALNEAKSKDILVFKTHPLEENSHIFAAQLLEEAQSLGLAQKVLVLQSGKLGTLAQHSSGMIIINSTSGFSAFHHHVPLLVLGDAIFRKPSLVTVGNNQASIVQFLKRRSVKCPETISSFIDSVKSEALLPGDFYGLTTQQTTAANVVRYVETAIQKKTISQKDIQQ